MGQALAFDSLKQGISAHLIGKAKARAVVVARFELGNVAL